MKMFLTQEKCTHMHRHKWYSGLSSVKWLMVSVLTIFMWQCSKDDVVTGPSVNTTDPSNDVTGVARNMDISFAFSEAMDLLTINSTTFTLKQGSTSVPGTVTYSGTTGTFSPTTALAANTLYTATITTGAKSLAGNSLAANTVWSFTTGGSSAMIPEVNLGLSGNYVILAKTGISNNSTSAITGDIGLSPAATSYITGLSLTDFT